MVNCRVCLKNPNSPQSLTLDHKKKFFQITGVELDETTEEFLCKKCLKLLLVSWEFRIGALNADDWFQKQKKKRLDEEKSIPEVKCEVLVEENVIVEAIPLQLEEKIEPQEEEMFVCEVCNAQFRTYREIRDHIRRHKKEISRLCRFCDRTFPNRTKTTQHERYHHLDKANRPSTTVCEQCGKFFPNLRNLQSHARSHAESYKCTIPGCSDFFSQKLHFYSHFATKHGIKQPCVCADCGKGFTNHFHLKSHRKYMHNEGAKISCPECPKLCISRGELENHIAIKHRGERNHCCTVCPRNYTSSSNLKRHYHDSHYDVYLEMLKTNKKWSQKRKF